VARRACSRIENDVRVRLVRVSARSSLTRFVQSRSGQKGQKGVKAAALDAWFHEVQGAE
jgi:hypothetical protein